MWSEARDFPANVDPVPFPGECGQISPCFQWGSVYTPLLSGTNRDRNVFPKLELLRRVDKASTKSGSKVAPQFACVLKWGVSVETCLVSPALSSLVLVWEPLMLPGRLN